MNASMTLEQKRAEDAWKRCAEYKENHINVAKSLPALIMNSGFMQVLAFCQEKGDANQAVANDLRRWLILRFSGVEKDPGFEAFMNSLISAKPADYQAITTEAFAWLRWMRQLAPARLKREMRD